MRPWYSVVYETEKGRSEIFFGEFWCLINCMGGILGYKRVHVSTSRVSMSWGSMLARICLWGANKLLTGQQNANISALINAFLQQANFGQFYRHFHHFKSNFTYLELNVSIIFLMCTACTLPAFQGTENIPGRDLRGHSHGIMLF